jgi:hypothetical protein
MLEIRVQTLMMAGECSTTMSSRGVETRHARDNKSSSEIKECHLHNLTRIHFNFTQEGWPRCCACTYGVSRHLNPPKGGMLKQTNNIAKDDADSTSS